MRYHIYFRRGDADIMLLLHSYKMADIVRAAVRAEIAGTRPGLPLPPMPAGPVRHLKSAFLRLDDRQDADVISWLAGIKRGYTGVVIKTLMRRATETADLRAFMRDGAETQAKAVKGGAPKPSDAQRRPQPRKQQQTQARGDAAETGKEGRDALFSLI